MQQKSIRRRQSNSSSRSIPIPLLLRCLKTSIDCYRPPTTIIIYDMPSLFAGKLHAVICRAWKTRVKGRDLYDYIFYLLRNVAVNMPHLKARLVDSGFINENFNLTREALISMLNECFSAIDYEQAKQDVIPFIKDKTKLDIWSKEFFTEITKKLDIFI